MIQFPGRNPLTDSMAHDFAKHNKTPPPSSGNGVRWLGFWTGMATGAFGMFLVMLWFFAPSPAQTPASLDTSTASPEESQDQDTTQWGFYDMLLGAVVPIVGGYKQAGDLDTNKNIIDVEHPWVLQVGSFKDPKDADTLRAKLILLGMQVKTQRIKVNDKQWNRVIVGPFDSAQSINQTRRTLANAQIKSILKPEDSSQKGD